MFEKLDKNRGYKKLELMVEVDANKHRKIYIGDDMHRIYLKSFCGEFDYRKYICEAVILRMLADKKVLKKVTKVYNNIYDAISDYIK